MSREPPLSYFNPTKRVRDDSGVLRARNNCEAGLFAVSRFLPSMGECCRACIQFEPQRPAEARGPHLLNNAFYQLKQHPWVNQYLRHGAEGALTVKVVDLERNIVESLPVVALRLFLFRM